MMAAARLLSCSSLRGRFVSCAAKMGAALRFGGGAVTALEPEAGRGFAAGRFRAERFGSC